jgi:hypothetical protein
MGYNTAANSRPGTTTLALRAVTQRSCLITSAPTSTSLFRRGFATRSRGAG